MQTDRILSILLLSSALAFAACSSGAPGPVATDYSVASHWLQVPAATDPVLAVDVFFLMPTSWQSSDEVNPRVCAIDDSTLLANAPGTLVRQANAFSTVGNLYAPYFRQDNLSPIDREAVIAGLPTLDATAAFEYYLEHFNKGRAFILAGHSQGSDVLSYLLSGYLKEHKDVYARMVAAYVIGYSVTPAYLQSNPHLKFATGARDTGVIVSYNTEAPDVAPGANPVLSLTGIGLVINPITWTLDETLATAAQGLGSLMPDAAREFQPGPQYADARIDTARGVLICTVCDEARLSGHLGPGVYHSFDYPFFYFNLRANAADRVAAYLAKSTTSKG